MPTGSAAGGGGGGDPCPPANLMPPRDVDAYLEQVALSRSNAVEDGAHRPTCRERGSIFGKWSGRSLDALDSDRMQSTIMAWLIDAIDAGCAGRDQ